MEVSTLAAAPYIIFVFDFSSSKSPKGNPVHLLTDPIVLRGIIPSN
jgi:hypothetical protein